MALDLRDPTPQCRLAQVNRATRLAYHETLITHHPDYFQLEAGIKLPSCPYRSGHCCPSSGEESTY
jgi:hypothetical protein